MPQTRLTAAQVSQARKMASDNVPQKTIAKKLKTSQTAISFLLNGKTYRFVA